MTQEFTSFAAFARHLGRLALVGPEVTHHIAKEGAKLIEGDAQERIGLYQDGTGPFVTWAPLAESTEQEKERLGYVGNSADYYQPLLRTGDLRDSIESKVEGGEAVVGSPSDIALYQELGTEHIPPRPFLGPAAYDSKAGIGERAALTIIAWVSGLGWKRPSQLIKLP